MSKLHLEERVQNVRETTEELAKELRELMMRLPENPDITPVPTSPSEPGAIVSDVVLEEEYAAEEDSMSSEPGKRSSRSSGGLSAHEDAPSLESAGSIYGMPAKGDIFFEAAPNRVHPNRGGRPPTRVTWNYSNNDGGVVSFCPTDDRAKAAMLDSMLGALSLGDLTLLGQLVNEKIVSLCGKR